MELSLPRGPPRKRAREPPLPKSTDNVSSYIKGLVSPDDDPSVTRELKLLIKRTGAVTDAVRSKGRSAKAIATQIASAGDAQNDAVEAGGPDAAASNSKLVDELERRLGNESGHRRIETKPMPPPKGRVITLEKTRGLKLCKEEEIQKLPSDIREASFAPGCNILDFREMNIKPLRTMEQYVESRAEARDVSLGSAMPKTGPVEQTVDSTYMGKSERLTHFATFSVSNSMNHVQRALREAREQYSCPDPLPQSVAYTPSKVSPQFATKLRAKAYPGKIGTCVRGDDCYQLLLKHPSGSFPGQVYHTEEEYKVIEDTGIQSRKKGMCYTCYVNIVALMSLNNPPGNAGSHIRTEITHDVERPGDYKRTAMLLPQEGQTNGVNEPFRAPTMDDFVPVMITVKFGDSPAMELPAFEEKASLICEPDRFFGDSSRNLKVGPIRPRDVRVLWTGPFTTEFLLRQWFSMSQGVDEVYAVGVKENSISERHKMILRTFLVPSAINSGFNPFHWVFQEDDAQTQEHFYEIAILLGVIVNREFNDKYGFSGCKRDPTVDYLAECVALEKRQIFGSEMRYPLWKMHEYDESPPFKESMAYHTTLLRIHVALSLLTFYGADPAITQKEKYPCLTAEEMMKAVGWFARVPEECIYPKRGSASFYAEKDKRWITRFKNLPDYLRNASAKLTQFICGHAKRIDFFSTHSVLDKVLATVASDQIYLSYSFFPTKDDSDGLVTGFYPEITQIPEWRTHRELTRPRSRLEVAQSDFRLIKYKTRLIRPPTPQTLLAQRFGGRSTFYTSAIFCDFQDSLAWMERRTASEFAIIDEMCDNYRCWSPYGPKARAFLIAIRDHENVRRSCMVFMTLLVRINIAQLLIERRKKREQEYDVCHLLRNFCYTHLDLACTMVLMNNAFDDETLRTRSKHTKVSVLEMNMPYPTRFSDGDDNPDMAQKMSLTKFIGNTKKRRTESSANAAAAAAAEGDQFVSRGGDCIGNIGKVLPRCCESRQFGVKCCDLCRRNTAYYRLVKCCLLQTVLGGYPECKEWVSFGQAMSWHYRLSMTDDREKLIKFMQTTPEILFASIREFCFQQIESNQPYSVIVRKYFASWPRFVEVARLSADLARSACVQNKFEDIGKMVTSAFSSLERFVHRRSLFNFTDYLQDAFQAIEANIVRKKTRARKPTAASVRAQQAQNQVASVDPSLMALMEDTEGMTGPEPDSSAWSLLRTADCIEKAKTLPMWLDEPTRLMIEAFVRRKSPSSAWIDLDSLAEIGVSERGIRMVKLSELQFRGARMNQAVRLAIGCISVRDYELIRYFFLISKRHTSIQSMPLSEEMRLTQIETIRLKYGFEKQHLLYGKYLPYSSCLVVHSSCCQSVHTVNSSSGPGYGQRSVRMRISDRGQYCDVKKSRSSMARNGVGPGATILRNDTKNWTNAMIEANRRLHYTPRCTREKVTMWPMVGFVVLFGRGEDRLATRRHPGNAGPFTQTACPKCGVATPYNIFMYGPNGFSCMHCDHSMRLQFAAPVCEACQRPFPPILPDRSMWAECMGPRKEPPGCVEAAKIRIIHDQEPFDVVFPPVNRMYVAAPCASVTGGSKKKPMYRGLVSTTMLYNVSAALSPQVRVVTSRRTAKRVENSSIGSSKTSSCHTQKTGNTAAGYSTKAAVKASAHGECQTVVSAYMLDDSENATWKYEPYYVCSACYRSSMCAEGTRLPTISEFRQLSDRRNSEHASSHIDFKRLRREHRKEIGQKRLRAESDLLQYDIACRKKRLANIQTGDLIVHTST